jgi:hypothetical protein
MGYRLIVYFAETPETERDRNKRYPSDFA